MSLPGVPKSYFRPTVESGRLIVPSLVETVMKLLWLLVRVNSIGRFRPNSICPLIARLTDSTRLRSSVD